MLPIKRILAPVDFSSPSEAAVSVAAEMASKMDSELCLVHVVPMLPTLPSFSTALHEGEYEKELHDEAGRRLAKIADRLGKQGIRAITKVGTANEVGMEIVRTAEEDQADLIVIATHGMTGWRKLAFGSVAEKVVRLATCPVLVLRAIEAEKAAESPALSTSASVAR